MPIYIISWQVEFGFENLFWPIPGCKRLIATGSLSRWHYPVRLLDGQASSLLMVKTPHVHVLCSFLVTARVIITFYMLQFSSVAQSCTTLWPHGLQHARLPCPSLSPRVCSNSCLLSQWCHPIISSSVTSSSCPQSFPASGFFSVSQLFASGGQSTGASASPSVLPVNFRVDFL